MIPELGHFALIAALVLSVIGAVLPHIGVKRGDSRMMAMSEPIAYGQFLMALTAFGALTYAYVISDFSVLNVAANSHTAKPMLYKISGVWATMKAA